MIRQLRSYAHVLGLFIASFLILHWLYGYVIAFQSETNDCFFMFGTAFLAEFFDHPAAPLRYTARFLGQFYYHSSLGALIVSTCITCFGFLFHRVLAKLETTVSIGQVLLPCVLLIALHISTSYALHDTLGLCTSCAAFLVYLSLSASKAKRTYAFVAAPIIYFLAGVHVWLFAAWIVVFEWLDRPLSSSLAFTISYIVYTLAVPLVAWRWLFLIPLRSAFVCPVMLGPPFRTGWADQTFVHSAVDCGLAAVLCGLLILIPFWSRMFSGTSLATFWQTKPDRRSRIALAVALGILAVLAHWIRYDAPLATITVCRQLYKERDWNGLLERARENPRGDFRVQFMTNIALYHKGTLLDEMFSYPQPWGTRGLFLNFSGMRVPTPAEDDSDDGMYNSDLLYEMGHANYAYRHAYNSMCLQGRTYESIARIAQCCMVNGNHARAKEYLNLLDRTLFYRGFARRYQAILADPDATKREFAALRGCLPTSDGFGHPVTYFTTLLEANPENRMALDYMVAWLLLDQRKDSIESIGRYLGQLKTVGYASMPTHCQEAMLLQEEADGVPVDLQGFRYDEATVARVDRFLERFARDWAGGDPERARDRYGHTYMFYCFFVTTPSEAQGVPEPAARFGGTTRQE